MIEILQSIQHVIIWLFFVYAIFVLIISLWIGISGLIAVLGYRRKNGLTDYKLIATNPHAPSFSIIAPAYNEGKTIIENVRSLLSVYYPNLEIVIVNDGSKDDSMEQLIDKYQLEKVSFLAKGQIETKTVRAVYKSKNPAFKKLVVVDKENGGKADALNVGVNISKGDYIVCIDVDCILDEDAILHLAKPFLEQTDKRLIACGGAIRLANNCTVENGKITDVNLPTSLLGRSQALEYIRAFVLGRMAWSRVNGLILISGAFGAFDKKIVLECGGYDANTVGEDMELVVRMRRHMEESGVAYEVKNIPEPLCWTEVPESMDILKKQRNRWMRGTIETLWKHRKMMFNPRYGKLGMLSLPYWFFFELLGPVVEFLGYILFALFFLTGLINGPFFFSILSLTVLASVIYSIYAVLVDLMSYQVYSKGKDLTKLIYTALLEAFYFHPMVVRSGINGIVDFSRKKHSWGEMQRQGFGEKQAKQSFWRFLSSSLQESLKSIGPILLLFMGLYLLVGLFEVGYYQYHFQHIHWHEVIGPILLNNLRFAFQASFIAAISYVFLSFFNRDFGLTFTKYFLLAVLLGQILLVLYFSKSLNLLGADLFFYSATEIKEIILRSGVLDWKVITVACSMILAFYFLLNKVVFKKFETVFFTTIAMFLGLFCWFVTPSFITDYFTKDKDEFMSSLMEGKMEYFAISSLEEFKNNSDLLNNISSFFDSKDPDPTESSYPFLRKEQTQDLLGSHLIKIPEAPNMVLIIVEGLGKAYSLNNGYVGSFTPFLDSLSQSSLVWENTLSTAGRTFGALPSILGSLPFGENGFMEINPIPQHFNLVNVLKANKYNTGFFYGGNADFDHMSRYLKASSVDQIIDEDDYEGGYTKLPLVDGASWGYDDQSLFNKYLSTVKPTTGPYFNVLLTLSSHSPFEINNRLHYEKVFETHLKSSKQGTVDYKLAKEYKKQLTSILNVDDAIREFINKYRNRADFGKTIFVITGDHSMPEIPLNSRLDRFHVPLIIYSPLLKMAKTFKGTVSHFDIAPSILAYYRTNYNLKTPNQVTWIGEGLIANPKIKENGYPLMQSKTMMDDYFLNNSYLSSNKVYQINQDLEVKQTSKDDGTSEVRKKFDRFKKRNQQFIQSKKLLPDSIYTDFVQ